VARWLSSVDPPQFIPVKRNEYSLTLYVLLHSVLPIFIFSPRVNHRAHQLEMAFHHEAPAYLDQDYPITIEVTNADIRDLDVVVNILLQPTEIDDAGILDGLTSCASNITSPLQ
jgi:trafficking protein particle complex subunit 11